MTMTKSHETFDPLELNRAALTRARRRRTRALWGGGLLIGLGISRRSLLGLPIAAYGLELLVEGLTDRPLSAHLKKLWAERGNRQFGNGTRDRVDEASWGSFPASDPAPVP